MAAINPNGLGNFLHSCEKRLRCLELGIKYQLHNEYNMIVIKLFCKLLNQRNQQTMLSIMAKPNILFKHL